MKRKRPLYRGSAVSGIVRINVAKADKIAALLAIIMTYLVEGSGLFSALIDGGMQFLETKCNLTDWTLS